MVDDGEIISAAEGAFTINEISDTTWSSALNYSGNINLSPDRIYFNAASYNSIYGSSTTVQPPTITLLPQIRY